MNHSVLEYAPVRGIENTELLKPEENELNIDFAEYDRKRELDLERLDDINGHGSVVGWYEATPADFKLNCKSDLISSGSKKRRYQ